LEESAKCILDLLALLDVRKENTFTEPGENDKLLYGKGIISKSYGPGVMYVRKSCPKLQE
jgi:hypothetical protein